MHKSILILAFGIWCSGPWSTWKQFGDFPFQTWLQSNCDIATSDMVVFFNWCLLARSLRSAAVWNTFSSFIIVLVLVVLHQWCEQQNRSSLRHCCCGAIVAVCAFSGLWCTTHSSWQWTIIGVCSYRGGSISHNPEVAMIVAIVIRLTRLMMSWNLSMEDQRVVYFSLCDWMHAQ